MDFATKFKLVFIIGLFGATAICLYATNFAKDQFSLSEVRLGVDPSYTRETLAKLMTGNSATATDAKAARFVTPILFPIDLILLACLGGGAALASLTLGGFAHVPERWMSCLLAVPLAYMAADLTENCLLTRLLLLPGLDLLTEPMVAVVRAATRAKLWCLKLGGLQLAVLAAVAAYFRLRG